MSGDTEAMDLGPAISLEDALTVIIVILVLRVVLFVPLITIDKAKLYHAEKETIWQTAHAWITSHKQSTPAVAQYEDAFGIGGRAVVISEAPEGRARYIEAADADNNLLVIRHDPQKQEYQSLFIQKFSSIPSYRHGKIKWSPQEKKWFTLDNQIDYNQTPQSQAMGESYRKWAESRKRTE